MYAVGYTVATCFDRKRSSSGQQRTVLFKVQKGITQWVPISFTVEYKILYKEIPIYN